MTRVWGLESGWQGHYGPRVQAERARKELEITGVTGWARRGERQKCIGWSSVRKTLRDLL